MIDQPPPVLPVSSSSPPDPPWLRWAVYRDADGVLIQVAMGRQHVFDTMALGLPAGLSMALLTGAHRLEMIQQYGFVDVDDPARSIAYDKDKLDAAGLTVADMVKPAEPPTPVWAGWPIKKPTKAT
jgi:hypothetical protein